MKNNESYAIITGASQGLGKAMAYEIAKRKLNMILVSLPNEGLKELSEELAQLFCIKVVYYEVDLTNKNELLRFTDRVNLNYSVSVLINNAGIGGTKGILACNVNYLINIINLNITATSLIIHQLLPNMLLSKYPAYILNVSSMASFSPIAYKTVYPASKRFIHDFSISLNHELKDSNVFVSVVHPGPMKTNEDVSKRILKHGLLGKIGLLSPERTAKLAINQLFKKHASIIPGKFNYLTKILMSVIPLCIKMPLISNQFKIQTEFKT
jgi:uncharacterized protein